MGQNKHSCPGVRHTPPPRHPSDTILFLGVHARAIPSTSSFLYLQPSRGGRGGGLPIVSFLNCGPTCKANSNARPQMDLRFARTPTIILTRKARPKKTRTTRIHFTTPVSWISAFSMHSLLICGGSILRLC